MTLQLLGCVITLMILSISPGSGLDTVTGLYGGTVVIPCNKGDVKVEDVRMIKWIYDKGDLLVKSKDRGVVYRDSPEYNGRVTLAADFSLLLSNATMSDERTFTCYRLIAMDILEDKVNVVIHRLPIQPMISEKARELEIGNLTKVGTCIAKDARPAANITWLRDNKPLLADGKAIIITQSKSMDSITLLTTTTSTLEYSAGKEDKAAQFTCRAEHPNSTNLISSPVTFTMKDSSEDNDGKKTKLVVGVVVGILVVMLVIGLAYWVSKHSSQRTYEVENVTFCRNHL